MKSLLFRLAQNQIDDYVWKGMRASDSYARKWIISHQNHGAYELCHSAGP